MSLPPEAILVLHLRHSRRKARDLATAEVAALLADAGARPRVGGPLSEVAGVAWVALEPRPVEEVRRRLRALGYTEAVELVLDAQDLDAGRVEADPTWSETRFKGRDVVLVPVYGEPDETLRQEAPDQRSFLLECGDGVVRRINGYRGGRGPLEHRALPAVDARMLVNVVGPSRPGEPLLDLFAGAGGVVAQARRAGWHAIAADADPTLRFGLDEVADAHLTADATALPIGTARIAAVATEPPYHPSADETVAASVAEVARVLRPGGRAAYLVAPSQVASVEETAERSGLSLCTKVAVDRKGTPVTCLVWELPVTAGASAAT